MNNKSKMDNFKEIYRVPGAELGLEAYQPSISADGDIIRICIGGRCTEMPIERLHKFMWSSGELDKISGEQLGQA